MARSAGAAAAPGAERLRQGQAHFRAGRFREAATQFAAAAKAAPADAQAPYLLGNARWYLGEVEDAVAAFDAALERAPEHVDAWINRGRTLQQLGRIEAAEASLRQAVACAPQLGRAWENLASVYRFHPDDPLVSDMERALGALAPDSDDARSLHFALGKAYHQMGQSPAAFGHYAAGNRLGARKARDLGASDRKFFDHIARQIDARTVERLRAAGVADSRPVFIVGMPRSGTTLVEQILAAHPQVEAGGERSDVGEVIGRARIPAAGAVGFPAWVPYMAPEDVTDLGQQLVDRLPATGDCLVTDKMPANFAFLGLLALMLPQARLIHVRRDPVATCFSCFRQYFTAGHGYSCDLAALGRYYRAYDGLMAHWQAVLPAGRVLTLSYETLLADPEGTVAQLLAHCGLAWDRRCLRFYETQRNVRTASTNQVRRPLDPQAATAWRAYRAFLGPLFRELGDLAGATNRQEDDALGSS